ncbi:MAG: hypothetical protein ABL893_21390 [Hyphomicrobium sp.]
MATIHTFRATSRRPASLQQMSAEIIIFPGIRYEYWTAPTAPESEPKRAKPAKSRRSRRVKRDFLEIA